jgi:DNA invertase Pin-like site-specific DNA recombinase
MRTERKQIEDFNLRVTYYARVSTTRDEQTMSIENQESHFREMISRNKNWQYVEGYADRIRGENAENRVQFQRMIHDAFDGRFDLILTKEVSRFARNTIDSLTYTRDLLKHGVGVFFLTDNICTIEPDSELRLTIMSSIAQDEVRKLSERVKFGHRKAIENGHVIGNSRIFGYDKDHSKLVINEKEAEMVKLIFEIYATGNYGLRDLERILWDKGYRSRAGKLIHHNTIGGIIQNPKYKGYYCGNKVKITDYRTKQQKFLPPEEWVMFKDETGEIVPAIVSEEMWDKANEIFAERSMKVKATDRSAKKTSPLSGKIICGVHNVPFWRTSYSKELHRDAPIYEWICREKKKGKSADCPTVAIYETELYKILSDMFIDLSENIDTYIEQFIALYENEDADRTVDRVTDDLLKEIEALEAKKDKLLDLYTEDAITKSEFRSRNDRLNTELIRLKTQLSDMRKDTASKTDTVKNVRNIRKAFDRELKTNNGELDRQTVNDLSDMLIDTITVFPEEGSTMRIEVRLKLGMTEEREYAGAMPRSGIIMKKMIESYQNSAK